MQIKDVITVASLPNNGQSDLSDDEGLNINKVGFVEASTIDRATYIATSIAEMIRNKREPIHLLCYYNKLLQDESLEVIRVLASVDPESRGKLIKTLFLDIVRITHKEIVITKHEYLLQIFLLFRNCFVNYFAPLIKDYNMCSVVDEIFSANSQLMRSLSDSTLMSN